MGMLFVISCTKTEAPTTPSPTPITQEESIKFTTNLDTGTFNVADTLPLVVTVSSKLPSAGLTYSILVNWTDSSKQIYKLDTSLTSSILNLNIPGLKKSGNYSLSISVTSKSTSSNTLNKSIPIVNNPLGRFLGYKVDANARQLGTDYWQNTNVLSDLIIAVYQKNYEEFDSYRAYTVFSTAICNGDFNNDGYIDVFNGGTAYNGKKANLSFLIWNPTLLEFEEKNLLNDKTDFIGAPYKVTPVYLNGDNYIDLVIHGHADEGRQNTNEPITLCISDGKGGYDLVKLELEPKELSNMFTHESGDVADINNDGRPDLFVVANSHSYIFWGTTSYPYFTNINFAHFVSDTVNYKSNNAFGESVSILNSSFNCRLLDLNKDGMKDLFVSGQSENTILFNKGNGRFTSTDFKKIPFNLPNGINVFDYIVDDLNNDGLNDIITLNAVSYKKWNIEIYIQKSDGSFSIDNNAIEYTINIERPNWKNKLVYYDFDGDGKKDITYSDAGINAYTNKAIINDIKLKSVFIRSNDKFIEKDYYQFDPYAKSLKVKYYK